MLKIENVVGWEIAGALNYSQKAALRGELGLSIMKARIMGGQEKYLQYILRGEGNALLKTVVKDITIASKVNRLNRK